MSFAKSSGHPARAVVLLSVALMACQGVSVQAANPEPTGWFAGDMHVHRSCGGSPVSIQTIYNNMGTHDLSVVSVLADMGNGEVLDPVTDLPKVNGQNDPISTSGRIVHWDAEWHWDATFFQLPHQALGGHVVALGLTNAYQIWEEYTYPVFQWTHQQGGIAGFAHMQGLASGFPQTLSCCTPVEYPVEVALGACDFISEDLEGGDPVLLAYYRLLNCGFRPGLGAGSDYPCNSAVLGSTLTYVQVSGSLTYDKWIDGIANGRTVVSRNGHNEFLSLKVNNTYSPGDQIQLPGSGSVSVTVQWTANQNLSGTIELVRNGVVVATRSASVTATTPHTWTTNITFTNSGWLVARRMGGGEHKTHTAAVFVIVNGAPIRASATDANFYVSWMDELLTRTSPGGVWSSYFPTSRAQAQARYQAAKEIYQQIAAEAAGLPLSITTTTLPNAQLNTPYSAKVFALGGHTPFTWSLTGGALPAGLTLNTNTGTITGTPTTLGTSFFTTRVSDASSPVQTATNTLSITVNTGSSPSTFGNTNEGTLTDYIWDNGPWINAAGFQATANMSVSTIKAKVMGVTGKYKCAIYSGNSTQPIGLLRTTTEVANPGSGWQTFPLTSSVTLTNGSFYWLAIWSDASNARVFYSGANGNVRWAPYSYGSWPNPISTTGGGTYNYCIYAIGTPGPAATDMTITMPEDTSTNLTLLGSGGSGAVTFDILTTPTNGVLGVLNTNTGAVSYSPNTNYYGPDAFRFTVREGSLQATGTVSLTITAVNDAPTLTLASNNVVVSEDSGPVTVAGFAVATDGPANESSQSITNMALLSITNATLFSSGPGISTNGTLTFTPAANNNGLSSVTTQARDNGGTANGGTNGSTARTFTITVTSVNDPPLANSQSVTNSEDTTFAITLGGSDVDGPLTNYVVVAQPANGTLSGMAPNVTYRGATNYIGPDSFTFTRNDGSLTSSVATITITLTNINEAPLANSQSLTNGEDTTFAITLGGSDVDGPLTNYVVVAQPTNGTLSGVVPNLTYRGSTNYIGPDNFTFTRNDGSLTSAVATVTITLTNINDAPLATSQSLTNGEDTTFAITLSGSDVDGPLTNYVVVAQPTNGTLSGVAPDLTYRGSTNYIGPDSFTFSRNDGSLTSAVATVTITLINVNDAPLANSQSLTNGEDTTFAITLGGSDVDGPLTNYVVVAQPSNGTLSGVAPNVTYRGSTNYIGPDSFTFSRNDGSLTSSVATVTITLTNINDAPTANNQTVVTLENTLTNIVLTASDSDGPDLNYAILEGPTNGILGTLDANTGWVSYTPGDGYDGPDALRFTVSDGSLFCTGMVSIAVIAVNNAPTANDQSMTNAEDTTFEISLAGSDADGPVTNFVVLTGPAFGNLSGAVPNLTYTGSTNYVGPDSFTFSVNDGSLTSAVAVVTITLTNVNDAPVLPIWTNRSTAELTLLTVTNTASDPDGDVLTYTLVATNALDGGLITNAVIDTNGVIEWTPGEAQGPGNYTFNTIVTDEGNPALSVTNSFTVTVAEVNSSPVLPEQNDLTVDVWSTMVVTNTGSDADLPANGLLYELFDAPAGATIDGNGVISWTPGSVQGDTTNRFTTVVSDDGIPSLITTNWFFVMVNPAPIIPSPVIESVVVSDGIATITWSAVSNQTYRLQYNEDIGLATWTDVLPDILASGPGATATNAVGVSTQRFYRVRLIPLP